MRNDTYISNELDSAGIKVQYDEHIKRILKDKDVLSYILKYSVKEFSDYTLEEAKASIYGEPEVLKRNVRTNKINTLENENSLPGEGKIYFDLLFYVLTKDSSREKIYINIEAQKSFYPGYDLVSRGIIYPAKLLSQQMDTEYTATNYDGAKKIYSIWICMNTPNKDINYDKVADTIVEYSIKPTILYPENTDVDIHLGRYDLLSTIFINLNSAETIFSKNKLIGMLSTLLSEKLNLDEKKQQLENEYGFCMSEDLEKGANTMCNLSEAIEERGIEKGIEIGMQQGIERGLQQGIEQGIEQGMQQAIIKLVYSGILSPELGAKELNISIEELNNLCQK